MTEKDEVKAKVKMSEDRLRSRLRLRSR